MIVAMSCPFISARGLPASTWWRWSFSVRCCSESPSVVRKIFDVVFQKYDDLNASVQENISGIRVVKAYVREAYEKMKFQKASGNLFKMFVKAEKILTFNGPAMMITVYSCMLLIIWLGRPHDVGSTLTTGELVSFCPTV